MGEPTLRADTALTRQRITDALRTFHADGDRPTAAELGVALRMSPNGIRHQIAAMREDGLVSIREVPSKKTRQEISLTEQEYPPDPAPDAVRS